MNDKYLQEGFLLSDKTISINLDKFVNSKNRLLFIIGGNGSGKTTLKHKLHRKYKIKAYETDEVMKTVVKKYRYGSGDDPFELYFKEIKKLVDSIKGKAIIEGTGLIYIWDYIEKKYSKNSSFILIGLSHIRGTIRQLLRNSKGVKSYWKDVDKMMIDWVDNGFKRKKKIYPPFILMRDIRKKLKKLNHNIKLYKL